MSASARSSGSWSPSDGHRGAPELAAGRWQTLSIVEQLANTGSEVERTIRAHESGRLDRRDNAMRRARELLDLTAADARWRGRRRREVLRAREYFCRPVFDPEIESDAGEFLRKYFLAFAVAARRRARPDH